MRFCDYALDNPTTIFLVQEIGCSKSSGYSPSDIAPMFVKVKDLENVYLPREFRAVLNNM